MDSKKLQIQAGFQVQAAGNKLPRFKMVAYTGKGLRQWWAESPVYVELAGIDYGDGELPILFAHDPERRVGHTEQVAVVDGQLVASGVVSGSGEDAAAVVEDAKRGFPWQASLGSRIDEIVFVPEGVNATVNGSELAGPFYHVKESTMDEISVVTVGEDNNTSTSIAASAAGSPALKARAESQRIAQIDDVCERLVAQANSAFCTREERSAYFDRLEASRQRAIQAGASAGMFELNELKTNPAPATELALKAGNNGHAEDDRVIEAGVLRSVGFSADQIAADRRYGEAVADIAKPQGLQQLVASVLRAAGQDAPHNPQELFRAMAAHHQMVKASAAFSTVSLPGILGNVGNKILHEAYMTPEVVFRDITTQSDRSDFKPSKRFQLVATGEFGVVPDGGELKHGQLKEAEFPAAQLDTRGMIVAITRQQFINDDMDAFHGVLKMLAKRAIVALEKAVLGQVMESADSFYTAARGNKLAGTSLNIDGLSAASAAIATMRDAAGDPTFTSGSMLLVPPRLYDAARSFYASAMLSHVVEGVATDDPQQIAGMPVSNPHARRFKPLTSPYLADDSFDGNSQSTWYMLADPKQVPAFEVAYLNGQRTPTLETADADFNTLGMQMRCYFDFGVGQVDPAGAIKCVAS